MCFRAIFVSVPETPVDENYGFVFGKNNIRFSRKFFYVHPVTEAFIEKILPYNKFRFGIFASDPGHIVASGFPGMNVGHRVTINLYSKIVFFYNITKKDGLENKETWAPCDPRYIDQLIGGWMRAGKDMVALKRRSPLSVSAMRPIHPLLGGLERDKENITFDRSDRPEWHPVNVRIEGSDRLMTKEEIEAYLQNNNRTLTKRIWIPDNTRATGLFVADMAIDLRALFCVTTNQHEPELSPEMITALEAEGWVKSKNVFGECLVMPKAEREKIIPVLANALINWRITSNQARTFSLMETLALAVSDNANHIAGAIRTKLIEEGDKPKAKLIIDETAGAEVFVTLPCASYVVTVNERAPALEEAEKKLTDMMMAFDYENQ